MLNAATNLGKMIIYRNLLHDSIIKKLIAIAEDPSDELQAEITFELIQNAERLALTGNIAQSYVVHLIARDENIFSQQSEKNHGEIGDSLYSAAVQDIRLLQKFIASLSSLFENQLLTSFTPTSAQAVAGHAELAACFADPQQTPEQLVSRLIRHYVHYGYGRLAQHIAFRWVTGQGLVGVPNFEPLTFQDIIGYDKQKNILLANTEAFVKGKPCNNALLVGARGTGKSSCVKALINHFQDEGLRLVEVSKHDQKDLYNVLNVLRTFGKRFIVFLDDLSFEENESEYKNLKSILEGGVEGRPDNVLIYATSNRQHLIRETWNDRSGSADDLHRFDTVNEKLSLADRFGLTVTFIAPNQEEYMTIIEELAKKHQLSIPPSELRSLAIKWEMTRSGRSGRAARQFIDHILGSV